LITPKLSKKARQSREVEAVSGLRLGRQTSKGRPETGWLAGGYR